MSLTNMRTSLPTALLITSVALGIPWPVGETGPDDLNSYTLMNTYGEMNQNWEDVGPSALTNFHTGIDIAKEDVGTAFWCENVWVVEGGMLTDKHPPYIGQAEYRVVISPSLDSELGWCYGHVQGNDGYPQDISNATVDETQFGFGHLLGTMAEGVAPRKHLHFARTASLAPSSYPGQDNPLDYLNPSASISWSMSSLNPSVFFLPDYPALDTPGSDNHWKSVWPTPASVFPDTLDQLALYGSVDIFYNILALGRGSHWVPDVNSEPVMPQRIQWTLSRYLPSGGGLDSLFTKYVVDFDGKLGEGLNGPTADWQQFKQLYFMYFISQLTGSGANAYIVCLTNSSFKSDYDGINNIEENCWETNQHISGIGTSTVPENAKYPEGSYQVKITSYAHNGDSLEVSKDVVVDNFVPHVNSVTVYMKSPYALLYQADWETLPCSTERVLSSTTFGYLSDSLPNNIGVALGISEPMNPDSLPDLWFTGEWGGSVGWSSAEMSEDYQLVPCEWDSVNLGPMPDDYWSYYCFETESGITDYHGQLKLNISGGKDLSGHPIDADPGTVALPRASSGAFPGGIEEGVDNSYLWEMGSPSFYLSWPRTNTTDRYTPISSTNELQETINGQYYVGISSGEFEVPFSLQQQKCSFVGKFPGAPWGQCPYYHGFWLHSDYSPEYLAMSFKVHIVDFEGTTVRTFQEFTRFPVWESGGPVPLPLRATTVDVDFISGSGRGNYCWAVAHSGITKPVSIASDRSEVEVYAWIDVYCFSAQGGVAQYFLAEGLTASFLHFDIDPLNEDNVIAHYNNEGVSHSVTLSPPSDDGVLAGQDIMSEINVNEVSIEPEVAFDLDLSPNPARTEAVFQVSLAQEGFVELSILDLTGRLVQRVIENYMPAGTHSVSAPLNLPGGIYFCQLRSWDEMECMKMVIIR